MRIITHYKDVIIGDIEKGGYLPPFLYILSGIPCSGKSTYAEKLRKLGYTIISRDEIRINYFGKYYIHNMSDEYKVTNIFNNLLREAIENKENIVLDNTFCKEKYLNEYFFNKPKGYHVEVIFFDIPLYKAYFRNIIRYFKTGKWIPFKIMQNMYTSYLNINKNRYKI